MYTNPFSGSDINRNPYLKKQIVLWDKLQVNEEGASR